jgi:hypothetical protein
MERWRGGLIYTLFRGHVVEAGKYQTLQEPPVSCGNGIDSPFGFAAVKLQKGRVRRLGRGVLGPGVRVWRVISCT